MSLITIKYLIFKQKQIYGNSNFISMLMIGRLLQSQTLSCYSPKIKKFLYNCELIEPQMPKE